MKMALKQAVHDSKLWIYSCYSSCYYCGTIF